MILSYFVEGRKAFKEGLRASQNPYPNKDSEAHKSWIDGWNHEWYASHEPGMFK